MSRTSEYVLGRAISVKLECKVHCVFWTFVFCTFVQYGCGWERISTDEVENITWSKNAMSLILYTKEI